MKKLHHFLLCLSFTLSMASSHAYAPVVDESENFAISSTPSESRQERALAHDDGTSKPYFGDTTPSASNGNQEIARLLNQLQELQQTVQELRGQIDNQNHIIETLKNQQLTLYKDLDARLNQLKSQPTAKAPSEPMPTQAQPELPKAKQNMPASTTASNPADEQISYMAAYGLVEKKEFKKAELALQDYIKQYPQSAYTPNAEYWLGEIYLQQKNYAAAIAHFENIVNNFPASNKHADALFKLGQALAENGQMADAKAKFQAVIQQYPNSEAAELAQKQLNR
jgi:tol-pal system protein YbgF